MINSIHTTSMLENFPSVPAQELQVSNPAQAFVTSSCRRQHTMSHAMQDSIDQGLSQNFAEAMAASINSSVSVFLGTFYNAHHDYELEVQECMWHPVAFHV